MWEFTLKINDLLKKSELVFQISQLSIISKKWSRTQNGPMDVRVQKRMTTTMSEIFLSVLEKLNHDFAWFLQKSKASMVGFFLISNLTSNGPSWAHTFLRDIWKTILKFCLINNFQCKFPHFQKKVKKKPELVKFIQYLLKILGYKNVIVSVMIWHIT